MKTYSINESVFRLGQIESDEAYRNIPLDYEGCVTPWRPMGNGFHSMNTQRAPWMSLPSHNNPFIHKYPSDILWNFLRPHPWRWPRAPLLLSAANTIFIRSYKRNRYREYTQIFRWQNCSRGLFSTDAWFVNSKKHAHSEYTSIQTKRIFNACCSVHTFMCCLFECLAHSKSRKRKFNGKINEWNQSVPQNMVNSWNVRV